MTAWHILEVPAQKMPAPSSNTARRLPTLQHPALQQKHRTPRGNPTKGTSANAEVGITLSKIPTMDSLAEQKAPTKQKKSAKALPDLLGLETERRSLFQIAPHQNLKSKVSRILLVFKRVTESRSLGAGSILSAHNWQK